jgi:glycosyltransferase involved in cell wall biosynthesis
MKVSIITISYNNADTIEDTILSVINQDYKNIEYIIVDGVSKDATLEIINKYKSKITTFVSEKDKGIYDALNKGIALATGDVIGMIHADDLYENNTVISDIVDTFIKSETQAVYADLNYVDRNDTSKIVRKWKSGVYKDGMFLKGWMPPHPTFFVRKICYEKFGTFNLKLKSSADYELMLRMIHVNKIKLEYLPKLIVNMRAGGQSNVNLMNRIRGNKEDRIAWQINNIKPKTFTLIRKPLSKLIQYLKM